MPDRTRRPRTRFHALGSTRAPSRTSSAPHERRLAPGADAVTREHLVPLVVIGRAGMAMEAGVGFGKERVVVAFGHRPADPSCDRSQAA